MPPNNIPKQKLTINTQAGSQGMHIVEKMFELKNLSIVLLRDEAAFNYKYADLAQIQDKIQPAMKDLRLLVMHSTENNAVCTRIYNVDEPSQFCESSIDIGKIKTTREWESKDRQKNIITNKEEVDNDAQAVGSIITYYRRYNLLQLLDLKTEDDDGASASPRAKNNSS